jgi:hypothetical protein
MTGVRAMIEFTPSAEARLTDYLEQVRAALAGSPDVNPDEIAADIQEHVEAELRPAPRPVSLRDLEAVLDRLGPPSNWLPAGRAVPPAGPSLRDYLRGRWKAARAALVRGPEDWRLAYLTFGVFAVGVFSVVFFPLFLFVSYFLGRAGIAVATGVEAKESGRTVGAAQRWLLYPPVVVVSLSLLLGCLLVPLAATGAIASGMEGEDRLERWELAGKPSGGPYSSSSSQLMAKHPDVVTTLDRLQAPFPGPQAVKDVLAVLFLGAGLCAFWWGLLGFVAGSFPGFVRGLFLPLLNGFDAKHGRRLGVVCAILFVMWAGFAYRLATEAGVI